MEPHRPQISVIIPTLNEENYITHALKGLRSQSLKDFEIIVVDGKSRDRTAEIARPVAHRIIEEALPGVSTARNTGAYTARGSVLLFLDADTKPSKNLLFSYASAFRKKGVVAATGPIMPLEKAGLFMRIGYFIVSVIFVKLSILLGRPAIIGSNFAVRKSAFDKAGGFDASMVTYEDWNLSRRLKSYGSVRYLNGAIVHTSVRRIKKWGMYGFFKFYMGNIIRYNLFKKPKTNYAPVR